MASLTDLPGEILHLIIRYLDLPNLHDGELHEFNIQSQTLSPCQFVNLVLATEEYDHNHQNGDALNLINTCTLMRDMMLATLWRGRVGADTAFGQLGPSAILSLTRETIGDVQRWVEVARATKEQLQELKTWKKVRPRVVLNSRARYRQNKLETLRKDEVLRARVVETARESPAALTLMLGLVDSDEEFPYWGHSCHQPRSRG